MIKHEALLQLNRFLEIFYAIYFKYFFQILNCLLLVRCDVAYLLLAGYLGKVGLPLMFEKPTALHTHAACSLFQPICQLLFQCLYPPGAMWGRPCILA